jgi:hypothetical protein
LFEALGSANSCWCWRGRGVLVAVGVVVVAFVDIIAFRVIGVVRVIDGIVIITIIIIRSVFVVAVSGTIRALVLACFIGLFEDVPPRCLICLWSRAFSMRHTTLQIGSVTDKLMTIAVGEFPARGQRHSILDAISC